MDLSSIVTIAVILFLVLGWGLMMADRTQAGWPSLLVAVWALPVAFFLHFLAVVAGKITWAQFWDDIKTTPDVLRDYLED